MLFAVQVSYASPEAVNEKDKKDSYSIIDSSQNVGKILVQSKFVGDPILESTKISVQVRCSENYKLNPKKKFQSIQVYDYGKNGILSKWDDKNKVYYLCANLFKNNCCESSINYNYICKISYFSLMTLNCSTNSFASTKRVVFGKILTIVLYCA